MIKTIECEMADHSGNIFCGHARWRHDDTLLEVVAGLNEYCSLRFVIRIWKRIKFIGGTLNLNLFFVVNSDLVVRQWCPPPPSLLPLLAQLLAHGTISWVPRYSYTAVCYPPA